jgi:hypothetical protein
MNGKMYLVDEHDIHVLQLLPCQAQPRQANLTAHPWHLTRPALGAVWA